MTRFATFFLTTANCISQCEDERDVFNNIFIHEYFWVNFLRQNNYFALLFPSTRFISPNKLQRPLSDFRTEMCWPKCQ